MINAERREELRSKLESVSMPERDKLILRTRFGLEDGNYRSLPETGRLVGMSPEGVRQVELRFYKLIGEK